jgi:hypothetical protein
MRSWLGGSMMVVVLTACGEYPAITEDAPADEPVLTLPDTTLVAPMVSSILPRDGTSTSAEVVVRVGFSRPMETLSAREAFALSCGGLLISGAVAFDTTQTMLVFSPASSLPLGDCDVVVDESATDAEGRPLLEPATARFLVAPPPPPK